MADPSPPEGALLSKTPTPKPQSRKEKEKSGRGEKRARRVFEKALFRTQHGGTKKGGRAGALAASERGACPMPENEAVV